MKENFNSLVEEAIRIYFENESSGELQKTIKGRTKFTKNYFDKVEREQNKGLTSDDLSK